MPGPVLAHINALYQEPLWNNRDNPDFSTDFIPRPHLDANGTCGVKSNPEWLEFAQLEEILHLVEQLIGGNQVDHGQTCNLMDQK